MLRNALRRLRAEPRFPDPPGPYRRDWLLVGVVVAGAVTEAALRRDLLWPVLGLTICVALAFTLPWRRVQPFAMAVVAFSPWAAADLVVLALGREAFGLYTTAFILLLVYSLVRWGSGREIIGGLMLVAVTAALGIATDWNGIGEAIAGEVFLSIPVLAAAAVRYSRVSEERERGQIRSRERERLARDLHDTVAHHVSAIAVQAQAGRTLAAARPGAAAEALEVIEEAASRTLVEMRAMVGALRGGDVAELGVARGARDIPGLAHDLADAPAVEVELAGDLDALGPSLDAALYRIAQEAITNAIRHARDATRIDVRVAAADGVVELTVADDGAPVPGGRPPYGYGLAGMSERAQLLGGTLDAGPRPGGGWAVTARLPRRPRRAG